MSKVEGGGGPIDPPPSRLRVTIFSRRLLGLTLEVLRGGSQIDTLSIFLALNFCSFTDCQKLWHNCCLLVNTSFDTN